MLGLVSQLAHLELESPCPEESVDFFKETLGFTETARDGTSVYLRCWGDAFHHSLAITEGRAPRVAHIGWRAGGKEQLETAAKRIENAGFGDGWVDPVLGHGTAYRYRSPGGHQHEIFWEVDRYEAPDGQRSAYPIRPQRITPVGPGIRQVDHVTLATTRMNDDIAFYRDVIGARFMECTVFEADDEEPFFAELSNNEQAHDLALLVDRADVLGRSHHIAFWLDQVVDVHRAADLLIDSGTPIEYGPGKHGHGENTYLYIREPGGHRVELFSGGYRNYQPDWEPRRWLAGTGGVDAYRNWPAPDAFLEIFPPAEDSAATIVLGDVNPLKIVDA